MTSVLLLLALLGQVAPPAGVAPDPVGPPPAPAPAPVLEISDPLLTPVPAATLQVGSWDEALAQVRQRSTDLRLALAQVELAVGQRRVALAALLPTLLGTVTLQYNLVGPTAYTGFTTTGVGYTTTTPLGVGALTANLPVFDLHALQSLRSVDASRQATELSLDETRRQLTRSLAQLLAQEASSERLADVNRSNLRSALERLALAQRRLELGAGTKLDVVRLRQDAEAARSSVVAGDESLRQARDALGLALGTEQPVGVTRDVSFEQLLDQGEHTCRPIPELARRPDQAAAHARQVASSRALTAARFSYLPTVQVQSSVAALTTDPGFAQVPVWNIYLVLNLPFYDGGVREGVLRQARAQEETARQQAVALERSGSVEVRRTRREVQVAREQQELSTQARELAAENDRLTRRSFEVGTGTSQDLVVSAAALRQAELNRVVSELQLFQARIEAYLAEAACEW